MLLPRPRDDEAREGRDDDEKLRVAIGGGMLMLAIDRPDRSAESCSAAWKAATRLGMSIGP